jgi:hypothetical protein
MSTVLKADGGRTDIRSVVESTKESTRVIGVMVGLLHTRTIYTSHTPPTTPVIYREGGESDRENMLTSDGSGGRHAEGR